MSEQPIIDNLREGKGDVLATIYKEYREEFVSWLIKSYPCSIEDAKDIYQFAVLTLYENIVDRRLTTLTSTVKTYLFAIGRNKALELNKKSNRFVSDTTTDLVDDSVDSKRDHLALNKDLETVSSSLTKLGDPCKTILTLYYYKRLSMDQIADQLGYNNKDTAKNMKYKCMKRLREIFISEQAEAGNG